MWVFHVDIYVHMGVKKFFILQKKVFCRNFLDIMGFFLYNQDAVFRNTGI